MNDKMNGMLTKGASALGGALVDGVSGFLKGGMQERNMGEDKIEALDTVTEVSKDMVPDMLSKAAVKLLGGSDNGECKKLSE